MESQDYPGPTCCQYGQIHGNNPIQYICLDKDCKANRLLCKICLRQSHISHQKGAIDRLIKPLELLSMNSNYQGSSNDYMFFSAQMQAIINEWQAVTEIFERAQAELSKGFIQQLEILMTTFTTEQIDKAQKILKNKDSDAEIVNNYVKILEFLQKDYLKDVEAMKEFTSDTTQRIVKALNRMGTKVQLVMSKTIAMINEMDFYSYEKVNKDVGVGRSEQKVEPMEKQQEETKMEEQDVKDKRPNKRQQPIPPPIDPAPATQPTSHRRPMIKYK